MMTSAYNARELLNWTPDQIWSLDDASDNRMVKLTFDDGEEVVAPVRATIFSWYFWAHHRAIGTMPLLPRHHLGNRELVDGVENEMCSVIQEDCILAAPDLDMSETNERLFRRVINDLYNDASARLEEYVTTFDIMDLILLVDYEPIYEANQKCIAQGASDYALKELYSTVKKILLNDPALAENTVARLVRQGLVKVNQVLQGITHRGSVQEINSQIFPTPILENYTEGVRDLVNSMMDSRSGTLASVNTTKPLQTSEYTNRKIQLVAMYIRDFAPEHDCGTKKTVRFHIPDEDALKIVDGCFHRTEDGELKLIRHFSKELVGTTVSLRNPATCNHKDPSKICRTCFGLLHYSIPKYTNLGWACATELCSGISQSVLSTKHLNFHAAAKLIKLITDSSNRWLQNSKRESEIVLDKKAKTKLNKLSVNIPMEAFLNLADLLQVPDMADISETSVSNVYQIAVVEGDPNDPTNFGHYVNVGEVSNPSVLTADFLEHIRNSKYVIDDENQRMIVPLENWDVTKPLIRQRLRHENSLDFVRRLKFLIEGVSEDRKSTKTANNMGYQRLLDCTSPTQAVNMAHDVISSKLTYHISMVGVLVRSLTVRDAYQNDYRMTTASQHFAIGKYSDIMKGRSQSASMAYQDQLRTIRNIDTYTEVTPPDHPLDWMMLAQGVR